MLTLQISQRMVESKAHEAGFLQKASFLHVPVHLTSRHRAFSTLDRHQFTTEGFFGNASAEIYFPISRFLEEVFLFLAKLFV